MTHNQKHIEELQRIAQGCSCEVTTDALDRLIAQAQAAPEPVQGEAVDLLELVRLNDEESKPHGIGAAYWNNAVVTCQAVIRDHAMAAAKPDAELVALLAECRKRLIDNGADGVLRGQIDAKIAELRKGEA